MTTTATDTAAVGTRVSPAERARFEREIVRVYVWQIPVRVTHWVIALSIVVLSVTGLYIGNPFIVTSRSPTVRFDMGTMKTIHMWAAVVFTLALFIRIAWMFLGNSYANWDKFLPLRGDRWRGLVPTLKFYLFARAKPPPFVGHNPMAGLSYSAIFFLYFVEIATGLALYGTSAHVDSLFRVFAGLAPLFGGLQVARWIHHVIMWLLIGFTLHHVYSSTLMSHIERNATVESIVSGYKFVPREELMHAGDRVIDRHEIRKAEQLEDRKQG